MIKIFKGVAILMSALCLGAASGAAAEIQANYEVIPLPQQILPARGLPFVLNSKTVISVPKGNKALHKNAELLADYLKNLSGISPAIVTKTHSKNAIVLSDNLKNDNPEAYSINIDNNLITINGASDAGNFYGIQTLRKSILTGGNASDQFIFPAVTINDAPRFGYRGAHFDTSRHFFPVDSLKTFIDMLALHNINRFHWHITDDQGWRLEIKKHPRLTEIGSKRKGTVVGHNDSGVFDGIPYGGFYTQDQARDIVKYASDRHITVIPEIDLPGHMLGALAAYPQLGCTGGPYEVWQQWGVADDVLCAGNDETLAFIGDVLEEVMDVFPSEYIHIGGDECPKVRWEKCPKCQERISKLGLKTDSHSTAEQKLQNFVMQHANNTLAARNRKMIGWDEILEGGLFPGATVMAWRGAEAAAETAKQGHDAILTPTNFCYFDYCQSPNPELEPLGIGGYVPVEKVYSLEPVSSELTPEQAKHIIGAQANLWTEYIPTFSHAQYMELPRLAAMSEVQWTQPDQKDYAYFTKRLPQLIDQYKNLGYNYAKHVFDVQGRLDSDPANHAIIATFSTVDDAPIYYTLDGSVPTEASIRYTNPVKINETAKIRAVVIRPDGRSREWTDSVSFNKATSSTVTLANEPHSRYASTGPGILTDGRFGGEAFNTGQWLGFNGADLDATIDLGTEQEISSVKFTALVNTPNWIFDTPEVIIEVSNDGKDFTKVADETFPEDTDHRIVLRPHTVKFTPTAARYVRVKARHLDKIPAWHGVGEGKPAFIFVDELVVD
ncbi:MAG: glycoside hydrolase family 20 protein [Firmicutes bacterium]|nr:glycoside hydrolase family 20 protein [Bacillota bacterium]MCM1401156.1 glycoside hydrolase family 20 protein [Bacteroides sp.]MCM1477021.1 glycoside hydrolase family 20 protein [Bacteroides sp.]